jgi:hypothetical protein
MTCDTLIRKHIGNENQLPQYMTKMHLQGKECFTLEDADEFKQLLMQTVDIQFIAVKSSA